MDGMCKESSRWVSLLVAEVYYPNAKQPLSSMMPQPSQLKSTVYNALNTMQNLNGLNNKVNGQSLPGYSNDGNAINYELFNSLLPTNYNEYNHYDQTFARRASFKSNNQPNSPVTPAANSKPAAISNNYPAATYSIPQYQELNLNSLNNLKNQYQAYQPNYAQQASQQITNYFQNNPQYSAKLNQAFNANPQARAQFQQLIDLYNQQNVKQPQYNNQQLLKSKSNINAGYGLIDSLTSEASMMFPTVVSQSSGAQPQAGFNQPIIQPIQPQNLQQLQQQAKQQNEIKPRSFDTLNNQNILESTLMKSSYINNNEEAAASNNEKTILNDQNVNQPTDLNNNNMNGNSNQVQPNQNDQNENSSRENANSGEECDGYDSNGCYLIRVYYDWFLVGGSCKCWKANAKQGSFEALKKMFIGK